MQPNLKVSPRGILGFLAADTCDIGEVLIKPISHIQKTKRSRHCTVSNTADGAVMT